LSDYLSASASVLTVANFARDLISRIRKKKKKKRATRKRHLAKLAQPPRLTKDEELAQQLLTNPNEALKKIAAEYLVKNRNRIVRNIEKAVVEAFS
jgi:hypothetical protein